MLKLFRSNRPTDQTIATINAWNVERADRPAPAPTVVRDGFDTIATDGRDPRWIAARARVAAAGLD